MIYIKSFSNYKDFKQVFGVRECGNGNKSRRNKILLECLKNRQFSEFCAYNTSEKFRALFAITNMTDFKWWLLKRLSESSTSIDGYYCEFPFERVLMGFKLPDLEVDGKGVCMDGDNNSIRYINHANNDRIFKMKAGKFLTKIMNACEFGRKMPEQARIWLCEEFLTSWQSYAMQNALDRNYEFHYGDDVEDFEHIYSSDYSRGDFDSCMTDKDYYDMYSNSVKAHAAWLTDANGKMFARCVIWDEVYDEETGETLRLAERQYSDGGQDKYKKMLVDELIKRDLIDGYKQIGASCRANNAFILNNGTDISSHRLRIDCDIEDGDHVSFMDSFVYYNRDNHNAYNYEPSSGYYENLATTDGYMEHDASLHEDDRWSNYNDAWIYEGEAYYVEARDDYFYEDQVVEDVHGQYQFVDDCETCASCGEYILKDDAYELDGFDYKYFCDSDCAQNWLDCHGYAWSEYDESYTKDELVEVNVLQHYCNGKPYWESMTMSLHTFSNAYRNGCIHELGGEYYLVYNAEEREEYKKKTLPAVIAAV